MFSKEVLTLVALAGLGLPTPLDLASRQSCPKVHVFGARETTASPGYGSSSTVVNLILNTYPGSTSEALSYPACGGQSSCGSVSYAQSVQQGVQAATTAINNYHTACPQTQLVLVGYSQGGQVFDDVLCGGGDSGESISSTAVPISSAAVAQIKAAIFQGDPRFVSGFSYEVGTCKAGGFDARPASFKCPSASKIQSYCDASDPYCCNGNNPATHQGYGNEYGQAALAFVKTKITA
ncbi:carbohydrate esterase family 5 protein [Myriangium duriaei CBS 260.36]|uniref:Carbohydrate esterase family 5 protein n=1 Tax=Myriangium duriaei CBS 260.36 TaxID=1168546 RepID=A0A9P4J817_9PEZI|nr:carbohydrate esterase family 5 protein [Myriangium duriaei CBS 260.36]